MIQKADIAAGRYPASLPDRGFFQQTTPSTAAGWLLSMRSSSRVARSKRPSPAHSGGHPALLGPGRGLDCGIQPG